MRDILPSMASAPERTRVAELGAGGSATAAAVLADLEVATAGRPNRAAFPPAEPLPPGRLGKLLEA